MKATARLPIGTTIALLILLIAPAASPQKTTPSQTDVLIDAHENVLAAVHSERAKLKLDKSTMFNVIGLARDLRDVELMIATRPVERIGAFNRFRSFARDLEADVKTASDRKMVDDLRAEADAQLAKAKRDAVQIEQINKQQRSLRLQQRNLWRSDLDGSPLVHPLLPPKLAENRR